MYKELSISFNKKNYNGIYNTLYLSGIGKILEENGLIKIYYKGNETKKIDEITKRLIKSVRLRSSDIKVNTLPSEDWNREWKMSIQPINIKNKILIYPSWKKHIIKEHTDKLLLEIDPKMSFGTGHNDTTKLILEIMVDNFDKKDKSLLDFGCGTGILAIAGIKLGIKSAVAIDIDDDSVRDAGEYININNVNSHIKLYKKDISEIKETKFDVVVCNIISSVILKNLGIIRSKLKPGGKLFLTGILKNERNKLINSIKENDMSVIEIRKKADWIAFYCKNLNPNKQS
jgi:ribosomal protein L11 methyltransferase